MDIFDESDPDFPHGDPFIGDPYFPMALRCGNDAGETMHIVLLSNVGNTHFVWIVEKRRFELMTIDLPDTITNS